MPQVKLNFKKHKSKKIQRKHKNKVLKKNQKLKQRNRTDRLYGLGSSKKRRKPSNLKPIGEPESSVQIPRI